MTTDNAPTTPAEAPHACSNCEGIDPDTCLVNPDRPRGDQDAPAPVDPALRDRVHAALRAVGEGDLDPGTGSDYGDQTAAVLAELAPELARAAQTETAQKRAEAMERAMRSTAADALKHGGCHRKLMTQVQRAEQAEAALAAGIPLICTDERHQAKVAALEAQVRRLGDLIDRLGPTEQKHRDDLATARAILADLTDPDPCWYDYHGYCQAHAWLATTPACPHARAKALTPPAAPEEG